MCVRVVAFNCQCAWIPNNAHWRLPLVEVLATRVVACLVCFRFFFTTVIMHVSHTDAPTYSLQWSQWPLLCNRLLPLYAIIKSTVYVQSQWPSGDGLRKEEGKKKSNDLWLCVYMLFVAISPKAKEQNKKEALNKQDEKANKRGKRGNTSQVSCQIVCCLFPHLANFSFCSFVLCRRKRIKGEKNVVKEETVWGWRETGSHLMTTVEGLRAWGAIVHVWRTAPFWWTEKTQIRVAKGWSNSGRTCGEMLFCILNRLGTRDSYGWRVNVAIWIHEFGGMSVDGYREKGRSVVLISGRLSICGRKTLY